MRDPLAGDDLAPGSQAGDYVISSKIARGGCGTVYAAEHPLLRRRAAVKVLHGHMASSPAMVERFVREARAANLIRHPNIVDIFEFGVLSDGRPYFVMELVEGTDLDALIRRHGRASPPEALEILRPIASALEAAHAAGIVHRDLKASNVAIADVGGRRSVKLLDFGIAKLIDPEPGAGQLTSVGRRLGTPFAMAPEQIRGGPIDPRTDIYALGVLLFHVLTARYPFASADVVEMDRMHLEAPPPRPSDFAPVPPAIDAVVLRCLEKKADRRFPSVAAFLSALEDAVVPREPPSPPSPASSPSSRGSEDRAAPGQRSNARAAAGIHVEARTDGIGDEEMDDPLLDDLAAVIDAAEAALREAGLSLPIQTASAVLGVLILPEEDRGARRRVLDLAASLHAALLRRDAADARIHVNVSVHCADVIARSTPRGPEVVSGPLMRIGAWVPRERRADVYLTPDAIEGLSG